MHSECFLLLGTLPSIIFPPLSALDPGFNAFLSVSYSALLKSAEKYSYQFTQEKNLIFVFGAFQKMKPLLGLCLGMNVYI